MGGGGGEGGMRGSHRQNGSITRSIRGFVEWNVECAVGYTVYNFRFLI